MLWWLMVSSVKRGYPYWITLILALVAGGIMVRIFILFHDCCHGSFFASRRPNTMLGYISGIVTFTPFEDWRYAHNLHHATAGNLDRRGVGAIWTMTKEEFLAAPIQTRLPNIPNYNLQQCYNEVPQFQAVKAITTGASFRSLRLGL
jgi:omega-6 fatty acid desaturase (delta-12 desaturase)